MYFVFLCFYKNEINITNKKKKNSKFTAKHLCQSLFFNKVAGLQACNFIKEETLLQVFSCEICKIFKNIYFYRTPLVAACVVSYFTLTFKF